MSARPEPWRWPTWAAVALYALSVAGVSCGIYGHAWHNALKTLDERLLAGAAAVAYVLPADFHDRTTSPDAVSAAEDERNIRELTRLARLGNFTYLYTVIRRDGHILITASSATAEELAAHQEVRYFDTYDEAQHLQTGVFDAARPVYTSYTDRWGSFRAVFLPGTSPGGNVFVAAAEVETGYVHAMLRHHLLESAVVTGALILAALPFLLGYLRKQKRDAAILQATNDRLVREMAERRAMEKELIRAHNLESLGKLAGGVAHDFNNILAALLGHAELAREAAGRDSPALPDLEAILLAGARAKDLTRQILTYARKTGSEIKPVAVCAVAQEVAELIGSVRPATIQFQARLESTATVLADPVHLHQIFMNLCTNAIQAMRDAGGRLTVTVTDAAPDADAACLRRCRPAPRYVQIEVLDSGPGIPPDIIDSIFEPYFTTKDAGVGSGLGLAVVQGIVASLGGDITVRSPPGQGSVFTVYLPALAGYLPPSPAPEAPPAQPRGTERILIVDDEPGLALLCARQLERLGYRTTVRSDSQEALALFQSAPDSFDLLIADVTMPNLTGDRLAAAAVRIHPGIRIILCSGYNDRLQGLSGQAGVARVLEKPVSGRELALAVRAVLDA